MTSVFEEKSIPKAIFRVGLPAMLGQLTTLIYNLADTFFVSMTENPDMIAAVTLCTPILLIIMSIAAVFGAGGSSVIARLMGEGKNKNAGSTLNFCGYAMGGAGIVTLAFGLLLLSQIARMQQTSAILVTICGIFSWVRRSSCCPMGLSTCSALQGKSKKARSALC